VSSFSRQGDLEEMPLLPRGGWPDAASHVLVPRVDVHYPFWNTHLRGSGIRTGLVSETALCGKPSRCSP